MGDTAAAGKGGAYLLSTMNTVRGMSSLRRSEYIRQWLVLMWMSVKVTSQYRLRPKVYCRPRDAAQRHTTATRVSHTAAKGRAASQAAGADTSKCRGPAPAPVHRCGADSHPTPPHSAHTPHPSRCSAPPRRSRPQAAPDGPSHPASRRFPWVRTTHQLRTSASARSGSRTSQTWWLTDVPRVLGRVRHAGAVGRSGNTSKRARAVSKHATAAAVRIHSTARRES